MSVYKGMVNKSIGYSLLQLGLEMLFLIQQLPLVLGGVKLAALRLTHGLIEIENKT
jgi:hypothetical protein